MGLFLSLWLLCSTPDESLVLYTTEGRVVNTFALGPPIQKATWEGAPRVRICHTTELSMFRVQKAIKYWEMLGYDFESVHTDYTLTCGEPRYGEIIITLPEGNLTELQMAATRTYTEKITGKIAKVKIFVYPKSGRKERVLEHEMGHALGWQHHKQKFHMMHPSWYLGGYDHTGLRK
tara:strand:- start:28 stop:558 length:531 start_codon:yes stop_codon:yes gene_type:complete